MGRERNKRISVEANTYPGNTGNIKVMSLDRELAIQTGPAAVGADASTVRTCPINARGAYLWDPARGGRAASPGALKPASVVAFSWHCRTARFSKRWFGGRARRAIEPWAASCWTVKLRYPRFCA